MPGSIELLTTIEELKVWRRTIHGTVGFVPTMGALHAGHAELARKCRERSQFSVLSIFVNPTQFGPAEDLSKYPRTFERDLELARLEGVDAVFAPSPDVMYPAGYSTFVEETLASQPLCGRFRPTHFRGVTTVVLKLLNLVRPNLALFGLKDAQQFFVIHKMARDLNLEISIEGTATVRSPDGLALSSRNAYLSAEDRNRAPALAQALHRAGQSIANGSPVERTLAEATHVLQQSGFDVQYFDCLELPALSTAHSISDQKPYLIATAAILGGTRLIDNVILNPQHLTALGIKID